MEVKWMEGAMKALDDIKDMEKAWRRDVPSASEWDIGHIGIENVLMAKTVERTIRSRITIWRRLRRNNQKKPSSVDT